MSRYHHTQFGATSLALLFAVSVVIALNGLHQPSLRWIMWAMLALMAVLAVMNATLTVDVDEREISWFFGPGLWRYRIARADIDGVSVVHRPCWAGYGIRWWGNARLYRVSGHDAVELRLKSGDVRRIGTDDPQGLVAALQS